MKLRERHGMTGTPEYKTWATMRNRCYNRNNRSHRYEGRGISVCPEWNNSFESFYKDMGPRPSEEHSIDRIDNDRHYEPGNCRWATREEQAYNRSTNIEVTIPSTGETLTSKEAAQKLGINKQTLYGRILRGTDIEIPVEERNKVYNYKCHIYTMDNLAKLSSVPARTIYRRIYDGWSIEDAVELPLHETNKYSHNGLWLTTEEIADMEDITASSLRQHLRKGTSVLEAVTFLKRNHQLIKDTETGENKLVRSDLYRRHGSAGSSLYTLWNNIRQWYGNPNNPDYKYYGGKGYKVSPRWLLSFQNFQSDVGERPSPEHILRPIQKEMLFGYGNFEWVHKSDIDRPTTLEIKLPDGRIVDIHEAMRVTGLKRKTIYERLRTGVSLEAPARGIYEHLGRKWTAEELSKEYGVPLKRLKKRIARGMPIEKAIIPDLR